MSDYRNILLATDFSKHHFKFAEKAKLLAIENQAKLSIIHVVDDIIMPDTAYGTIIPLQEDFTASEAFDSNLLAERIDKINTTAESLQIPQANRWLIRGRPTEEIMGIAKQNIVDLIVVGSHGRHGLELLLGSTANKILHQAICDVLAVKISE